MITLTIIFIIAGICLSALSWFAIDACTDPVPGLLECLNMCLVIGMSLVGFAIAIYSCSRCGGNCEPFQEVINKNFPSIIMAIAGLIAIPSATCLVLLTSNTTPCRCGKCVMGHVAGMLAISIIMFVLGLGLTVSSVMREKVGK